nr:hypothetical protein [Methanothrix sp.]
MFRMILGAPQIQWWVQDFVHHEEMLAEFNQNVAIGVKFCNLDHYFRTRGWWTGNRHLTNGYSNTGEIFMSEIMPEPEPGARAEKSEVDVNGGCEAETSQPAACREDNAGWRCDRRYPEDYFDAAEHFIDASDEPQHWLVAVIGTVQPVGQNDTVGEILANHESRIAALES